jgi:hypothetical protein
MMAFRSFISASFLLLTAITVTVVHGFTTMPKSNGWKANTALQFGFLKELGLEKPSWLPDFGGKKEDPAPTLEEENKEEAEEGSAETATAEE